MDDISDGHKDAAFGNETQLLYLYTHYYKHTRHVLKRFRLKQSMRKHVGFFLCLFISYFTSFIYIAQLKTPGVDQSALNIGQNTYNKK